jgi:uncharacterized protein
MTLEQRIADDYLTALRGRDEDRRNALRLLRSAIHNATIDARHALDDKEVEHVLRREARQRKDSIEMYGQGGRMDLVAAEEYELAVIESYLPQPMSADEIEALVREQIAAAGATSMADMGKVMRPLMATLGDRADGAQVSAIVRRLLAG